MMNDRNFDTIVGNRFKSPLMYTTYLKIYDIFGGMYNRFIIHNNNPPQYADPTKSDAT